jgi:DNA polymerase (family 10)
MTKPPDERYKPRIFFLQTAEMLQEMLKGFQFEICGSWRRQRPFLKDLDVLILLKNDGDLEELESLASLTGHRDYGGNSRMTYWFGPVQVDFRTVNDPKIWGSMLCHFTGSKEENIRLRRKALSMGMSLSEYGLRKDEAVVASEKEEDIYRVLGEPWREPWERDPS